MANYAFSDLSITTTSSTDISDADNEYEIGSAISTVTAGNPIVVTGNNTVSSVGIIEQLGSTSKRGWEGNRPVTGMIYPRGVYTK